VLAEEPLNSKFGSHFVGTTTFDRSSARTLALITEPLLTSEFSGPENSRSLCILE
jgi:hypothetical protein